MARAKGYAKWNPKHETQVILQQVNAILREYESFLPLTARQIFYRMVGAYGYAKTERAYANMCEYLVRARRAQLIPFGSIRDDGTTHHEFVKYQGVTNFWEQMTDHADHFVRDKLADQPVYVELWCEAAGMVPQLERVANRFSIPVYSTGGFSSVTVTYEIADRALKRDKPTVFLHVGDYDPSGESIFDAMTTDAQQFLYNRLIWKLRDGTQHGDDDESALPDPSQWLLARRQAEMARNRKVYEDNWNGTSLYPVGDLPAHVPDLRPTRVALTGDQVEEYDLPTAPPKPSDTRSVNWVGETCQLEALPPDTLADVVEDAILDVLDRDLLEAMWDRERNERVQIKDAVAKIIESGGTI